MKIFILNTCLFPAKNILEEAIEQIGSDHEISRHDLNAELTNDDWDHILQELMSSDRIVTL